MSSRYRRLGPDSGRTRNAGARRLRAERSSGHTRVDAVVEPDGDAFRGRAYLVLGVFVVGWLLLIGRSGWLAVGPDDRLAARTTGQHERVITVAPQRGSIVDRMGRPLAVSVELGSVYADPSMVEDPASAADLLAPLIERDDLEARLGKEGSRFQWLGRQLPKTVTDRIKALDIPGVRVTPESHREYPSGPVAGPVLGIVNVDGKGLEGLEYRHDDTLTGDRFQYRVLRDGRRRATNHSGVLARRGTEGRTLVLTLDHSIQHRAEAALEAAIDRHEAEAGWLVSLDAKSGAVLALASYPDYDPNQFRKVGADRRRNRAISEVFEPGSTMKPFVFAEAFEKGLATPDEEIYLEKGRYRIGRRIIRDAHAHDRLDVADIIKVSSNIGTAKVAERMGPKGLEEMYRRFGFGARTGIDLSGEERGLLSASENWSRVGFANRAFGQGIGVTGIQLTAAFAALVNGGIAVQPHIVSHTRDAEGMVDDLSPPRGERVLSAETSRTMRHLMARVLEEGGTGVRARPLEYIAGGKTGTAQKVVDGRYAQNVYVSSFIGFAPVSDPRVVTLVVLDEPKNKHYGGTVAGPAFAEVTTHALRVLGVSPQASDDAPMLLSSDPEGESEATPARELPVLAPTEDGAAWALPDLTGWSARDVIQVLLPAGARVDIEGTGLVAGQTPAPGAHVSSGDVVTLALAPRRTDGATR